MSADALVRDYLARLLRAAQRNDGRGMAGLLGQHYGGPRFAEAMCTIDVQAVCDATLVPEFASWVGPHLQSVAHTAQRNPDAAFGAKKDAVNKFLVYMQSATNWIVPVMHALGRDFLTLAKQADASARAEGDRLHECENIMKRMFKYAFNDRGPLEESKALGSLYVATLLFKLYVLVNSPGLAKHCINSISTSPKFADMDSLPRAHVVTYRYYLGRLLMFEDKFAEAADALEYAFRHCPRSSPRNKRKALEFLVPLKLRCGALPTRELLQKHQLTQYQGLADAVRTGNLQLFNDTMRTHEEYFVSRGTFLILQQLYNLVFRTFVKRVLHLLDTSRLHLELLREPLEAMGIPFDMDELECTLANLIEMKMIKGYISHARQYLVVSKTDAFPPVHS